MNNLGKIYSINASIIRVTGSENFKMSEMVFVGRKKLIGEVIAINNDKATIQVFENTAGLEIGEEVFGTGKPISIKLGPGLISNIFDGIKRPLESIANNCGIYIENSLLLDFVNNEKKWNIEILVKVGDFLNDGFVFGKTKETSSITHKLMVPYNKGGVVKKAVNSGEFAIDDVLLIIEDLDKNLHEITMIHEWPIRVPRPVKKRICSYKPLITGQRIIDTLFPLAKGGTAAIPGGFGTGKTMNQHQIAKWSDADIIIYVGCGERGNEITQVIEEFSNLVDPKTGNKLMDRTILIANTSNMPVASREASIYTGITLAEYYRDMGFDVTLMADSTSRWAEALRELSGRLEEMPAEEGFPAYLSSRIAAFYERAGYVQNLNDSEGSITIIGAISPQGGDFSEPVTQNTKRFVRCFWTLDRSLAYARHFPAINWLTSYSEYVDDLRKWYVDNIGENFLEYRQKIIKILNEEKKLMEIVNLIGIDVLPDNQKLILEIAKIIRVGFLQQNAYHKFDTFVSLQKQSKMMKVILYLYEKSEKLIQMDLPFSLLKQNDIFDQLISIKYNVSNDDLDKFEEYTKLIDNFYNTVYEENI